MSRSCLGMLSLAAAMLAAIGPAAARAPSAERPPPRYSLRYKFQPGELLRWNVVHRCCIRTTVSGTTQTAETTTSSVKLWRVGEVRADGTAVFEHVVESVNMRHTLTGRDEVHYNSRSHAVPPRL